VPLIEQRRKARGHSRAYRARRRAAQIPEREALVRERPVSASMS